MFPVYKPTDNRNIKLSLIAFVTWPFCALFLQNKLIGALLGLLFEIKNQKAKLLATAEDDYNASIRKEHSTLEDLIVEKWVTV